MHFLPVRASLLFMLSMVSAFLSFAFFSFLFFSSLSFIHIFPFFCMNPYNSIFFLVSISLFKSPKLSLGVPTEYSSYANSLIQIFFIDRHTPQCDILGKYVCRGDHFLSLVAMIPFSLKKLFSKSEIVTDMSTVWPVAKTLLSDLPFNKC